MIARALVAAAAVAASAVACTNDDRPERVADDVRPDLVVVLTDDQPAETLDADAMPWLASRPGGHWWVATMTYDLAVCCPSRATMLTGLEARHTGVVDNRSGDQLDERSTVVRSLDDAGYHTCKVGKYLNEWPFGSDLDPPMGWDSFVSFVDDAAYYDYSLAVDGDVVEHGHRPDDYSTDVLLGHALDCISDAPEDAPLYLDLSFFAPHGPATPSEAHRDDPVSLPARLPSFNEADVSDKAAAVQARDRLTVEDAATLDARRADVRRSLRSVDDALEVLFDALDLERTVVFVTADNANMFGEHRLVGKRCWYEECLRFPLLVRWPRGPEETRIDDHLVGNVDLAPTLAALGGTTLPHDADGRSLVPLLEGRSPAWRDAILIEDRSPRGGDGFLGNHWGLRTDRYTYVELDTGEIELYDHETDPYELDNIGADADAATLRAQLHARLEALRGDADG